jgi:hypothetical protein
MTARAILLESEPHGYAPALDVDLGEETASLFEGDFRWRIPESDDEQGILRRHGPLALFEI